MNIRTLKRVLQIGGLLISFAGTLLDTKIQQMDTEIAVDKWMNKRVQDAMTMASMENNEVVDAIDVK